MSHEEKNKIKEYQKERYQELVQHKKETYSKEKAAEYHLQNKEAIKEKARDCYKNLHKKRKMKLKSIKKRCIKNWFSIKKKG